MAIRMSELENQKLDESRSQQGIRDADFTLRFGLVNKVLWTPDNSVKHNLASQNRLNLQNYIYEAHNYRKKLSIAFPSNV